ncbi:MAG: MarR family transcriptional regulator [Bdellovibrionales bacterium]|nr:MarR family transcriptional regulator [Bdellovibrionales bacterium]
MTAHELAERSELWCTFHNCGRSFAIQHDYVNRAFGTELSIAANHLLIDIAGDPELRATDFAAESGLSKTEVSRLLKSLEMADLVVQSESEFDRRRRRLSLTTHGVELLRLMNERSNARIEKMYDRLSEEEQQKLLRFFALVCDAMGARPLDIRVGLHPLRAFVEGLTRSKGTLSSNLHRVKGLNQLKWYILKELEQGTASSTLSSLSEALSSPLNTVSQAVTSLVADGYVSKHRDPSDRRRQILGLRARGRKVVQQSDQRQADQYVQATRHLPLELLKEGVELTEKLVGLRRADSAEFLFGDGKRFRELQSDEDRASVRPALIEHLVVSRRHFYASSTLLASENRSFALMQDKKVKSICEISERESSHRLVHFASAADISGSELERDFLLECYRASTRGKDSHLALKASRCWIDDRLGFCPDRSGTEYSISEASLSLR